MSRGKHREACTHPSMYISLLPMYAHSCNKVVLLKDGKELAPNSRVYPENREGQKKRSLQLVTLSSCKAKAKPTPPPPGSPKSKKAKPTPPSPRQAVIQVMSQSSSSQSSSSLTSSSSTGGDSGDVAVEMSAPQAPMIPACDAWTSEDLPGLLVRMHVCI